MAPFVPFGADHVCALAAVAVVASAAALALRRVGRTGALAIRWALALAIVVALGAEIGRGAIEGWLTLEALVPLHLCDAALLLAVVGLLWPRQGLVEMLYFWTFGATFAAMAFPDLAVGFPRWEFVVFFGLHGLVIVAATALVFGMGLTPRRGAALRVFAVTNALRASSWGWSTWRCGTNYLYLCAKPSNPTLLDCFGPWPVYISS